MGAGQIGGIATILDIDFKNAAGFHGVQAEITEGQFVVYYLSHALLFCVGALIEPHVVLTPALCVFGEKYKFEVYAGTHKFLLNAGISRIAQHICIHKGSETTGMILINISPTDSYITLDEDVDDIGYNHTKRWTECSPQNLALLVLNKPFSFHEVETNADFVVNRLRYAGASTPKLTFRVIEGQKCRYFGFGSRRNGFLLPLLINLRKVEVVILPPDRCLPMWNNEDQMLCIQQLPCKDDVGSVIECSGFAVGMMVSRLIDRPCGVGFVDLQKNNKFITCGVDDARDVVNHDNYMVFDFATHRPSTPSLATVASIEIETTPSMPTPTTETVISTNDSQKRSGSIPWDYYEV